MAKKNKNENQENIETKTAEEAVLEGTVEEAKSEEKKEEKDISLADELATVKAELELTKGQYLRLRADFDNFRRNKELEMSKAKNTGMILVLEQILPALDSFDRALQAELSEKEKQGILLIKKQLEDALTKMGVVEIKALGEPFNPKFHYAVMSVEDKENEGKVLEVFQKGYTLGKDIIRYSMVKVAN